MSRPTEWNLPLFLHVFGAMILVGGLLTGASAIAYARGDVRSLRVGYWTLSGRASRLHRHANRCAVDLLEGGLGRPPGGHGADLAGDRLVHRRRGLSALLLAPDRRRCRLHRLRSGKGTGLLKATMIISLALLAAYVVTVWAMAGKPD